MTSIHNISDKLKRIIIGRAIGENITVDPIFDELLDMYMNDVNSSTVRELITIYLSNCEPLPGKLGRDCKDLNTGEEKEIKPKNYYGKKPHDGSGCFNDYTRKRFRKDLSDNLHIISSFFINGKVAYIIEFSIHALENRLDRQIYEKCESKKNNDYVRSAVWSYKDWMNHPSLKLHYINNDLINDNPKSMTKNFLEVIKSIK